MLAKSCSMSHGQPVLGSRRRRMIPVSRAMSRSSLMVYREHTMAELKTISGDPAAATEIFKRLLEIYDKDGTTNAAAVLCAAGALGGFACQQAVWKRCIEP